MATDPHPPRVDATTGYWFTRWREDGQRKGKTFGHKSKVTRGEAKRRYMAWLMRRGGEDSKVVGNTVGGIIDGYLEHAATYYRRPDGKQTGEAVNVKYALEPLRELFGNLDVGKLRPRHIHEYIEEQIARESARSTINKRLGIIKRMTAWATEHEYAPPAVHAAVSVVAPLAAGRTKAEEPEKITAAPIRHVAAALRHMDPVVSAMVRLQWLTGMRPGEVCGLTPAEIDRTRQTWLYVPAQHKTAWRGKGKVVAFGPRARAILQPFLFREASSPCFSPQESRRWWNERRRETATAPRAAGSLKGTYARVGTGFTSKTLADAVERACRKAGVPIWTPNQLRHGAATRTERREGREAARILLGHGSGKTTAIYIDEDIRKAMELAERAG